MGVILEEEVVEGPIDAEGLRGIPPEIYARTPVDVVEKYARDGVFQKLNVMHMITSCND